MEATILLANSAENNGGMVSALGLGWSMTGSPTPPAALVLLLKVPWDLTNRKHTGILTLVDADGHAPRNPDGTDMEVRIEVQFEVGRPPGLPVGTDIDQAVVINIPPGIPLAPGTTFQWRLEINGEQEAVRSFFVRAS